MELKNQLHFQKECCEVMEVRKLAKGVNFPLIDVTGVQNSRKDYTLSAGNPLDTTWVLHGRYDPRSTCRENHPGNRSTSEVTEVQGTIGVIVTRYLNQTFKKVISAAEHCPPYPE